MIYYTIEIEGIIFQVKRLSLTVPLFKVMHHDGFMEIYKNPSSGNWTTLFCSSSCKDILAFKIGPEIENYYRLFILLAFPSASPI